MAAHMANLNEIYQAIGKLTAEVKSLQGAVEKAERAAVHSADQGVESRAAIHRRMDSVLTEVSQIKEDVAEMKTDVASAKQVTEEVKRWKLMGMGALGVTGIAAGAIGASISYWWEAIKRTLLGG